SSTPRREPSPAEARKRFRRMGSADCENGNLECSSFATFANETLTADGSDFALFFLVMLRRMDEEQQHAIEREERGGSEEGGAPVRARRVEMHERITKHGPEETAEAAGALHHAHEAALRVCIHGARGDAVERGSREAVADGNAAAHEQQQRDSARGGQN